MKSVLVGYTGFVGSNILQSHSFDEVYNSKNIKDSFGSNPDLLVYAGLRAEKFIANKFPEQDLKSIQEAMSNITKINPKVVVLISTIDVYHEANMVDEASMENAEKLLSYGKHRLLLEKWVAKKYASHLIVRLPGLYGMNIKKNFIYDMIHFLPTLLNENKFQELKAKDKLISKYYVLQDNGFYKLQEVNVEQRKQLKESFKKLSFSALNFTDSRGVFQYYNLQYLWQHITLALENKITILNVATAPVSISELYQYIYKQDFINEILEVPPYYNFKTKYSTLFGGYNGYIFDKEFILKDIKQFVEVQDEISNL